MKKQIISITFLIIGAAFFISCSVAGSGAEVLTLKYPTTENREMPVKSGGFYTSTKSWTRNTQMSKSSSYFVCVSDSEIDLTQGAISIGAPVKNDAQTKVCFNIDGAENTDDKTPPKAETYAAAKRSDSFAFNSVSSASIRTFQGGKEVKHFLDESKMTGDVKITSATENTMSGEINLSDGEKEIKGSFTAKGFERK